MCAVEHDFKIGFSEMGRLVREEGKGQNSRTIKQTDIHQLYFDIKNIHYCTKFVTVMTKKHVFDKNCFTHLYI